MRRAVGNAAAGASEISEPPAGPAAATVLLMMMSCGIALITAYCRGPWNDEFASMFWADPAIPWSRAWLEYWHLDTNPPFYCMIARVAAAAFGKSILVGRLINAVPLAFMIFWFAFAWRRCPERRGSLMAYASLIFGGMSFLVMFPNYRSYFWQYCAAVVFIGAASIRSDRGWAPDPFQIVATPLLLLLHEVTAIYALIFIFLLVIDDCRRRLWTRAGAQIVIAAASLIPLIVFATMQWKHLDSTLMRVAWIVPHTPLGAIGTLLGYLTRALGQNWVAIFAAAGVILGVGRRFDPDRRRFAVMLVGALLVATAVTLAINASHPIILERYYMFLYADAALCHSDADRA
jgi:hypothetical protein